MAVASGTTLPITGGTITAKCGTADNSFVISGVDATGCIAPDLSGYASYEATANTIDQSWGAFPYVPADFASYRYFHIKPVPTISITPDTAFPAGASGGDRTVTIGRNSELAANEIGALSVGNQTLTENRDYTKTGGPSVVITLSESWLNSLPAGTHRLKAAVIQGTYAEHMPYVNIVVSGPGGANVPKTGDASLPGLWIGILLLAGAGLILSRKRRRA